MYQPFTGELGRQHRSQLMHEAETYRLTKTTRVARTAARRATLHRAVLNAISLFGGPTKH
ncbi:MAG TPA: hypothetical protein VHI54_02420 [Actinomycetota bacterium]|nr:hypothetical protein [Actinomycetota bacterium]